MFTTLSYGDILREEQARIEEVWSDAARAASAAARRSRAGGGTKTAWKKAARNAYAAKGGSPESEKKAIALIKKQSDADVARQKIKGSTALGMSGVVRQMKANAAANGRGRLQRKMLRFGHPREPGTKSVKAMRAKFSQRIK